MLVPVFTLDLKQKVLPGRVCIGKYDSAHACLTASTTADKVREPCAREGSCIPVSHVIVQDLMLGVLYVVCVP